MALSQTMQERFADYLFDLYEGRIPIVVKDKVDRVEGDTVYLKRGGIAGALLLRSPPYDANMAMLGFALFGVFWPTLLPNVDKIVRKRWKTLCAKQISE